MHSFKFFAPLLALLLLASCGDSSGTRKNEKEGDNDNNPVVVTGPIQIHTAAELNDVRKNLSGHYTLAANISLKSYENWEPIGTGEAPFKGKFDGNGHKITDLKIQRPTEVSIGLFGCVDGGQLTHIALENADVTGEYEVGGIVGYLAKNSSITNSHSTGKIAAEDMRAGGIVGGMSESTITNSYSTGAITSAGGEAGGIAGSMFEGTITNSHSTGKVTATGGDGDVGGIVGFMRYSTITNSYSTGEITSTAEDGYAGGIAGLMRDSTTTNSYNKGKVTAKNGFAGGLVGDMDNSEITRSYSTGEIAANKEAGGIAGTLRKSSITNSYSTGDVASTNMYAGGIAGSMDNSKITHNYSTGTVTTEHGLFAGGIVGSAVRSLGGSTGGSTLSNCAAMNPSINIYPVELSKRIIAYTTTDEVIENNFTWQETVNSAGNTFGYPEHNSVDKTTEELKTQSTYDGPTPGGLGWDFTSTWKMPAAEGYPILVWQ